ncbi:CHAT domain-containing protein [Mycena galopus ATCC 62051]|nr:CHAT domain-containing protein [Mycena galopus ATCC 62051]
MATTRAMARLRRKPGFAHALTSLPIHAAGHGKEDSFGSKLIDFVISSYTPSLTVLLEAFREESDSQRGLKLFAVAQPSADGQSNIPGTQKGNRWYSTTCPVNSPPDRISSVQRGMQDSHLVQFTCDRVQNVATPTKSALLVAQSSRLTLSDITELSVPHADLAFFSACQTPTGAMELQEESVHLADGMLLPGYQGVIATMWSIRDNDAPQTFPPNPSQAAEGLHFAVKKLRDGSGGK